jgi:hypothetical protein
MKRYSHLLYYKKATYILLPWPGAAFLSLATDSERLQCLAKRTKSGCIQ